MVTSLLVISYQILEFVIKDHQKSSFSELYDFKLHLHLRGLMINDIRFNTRKLELFAK